MTREQLEILFEEKNDEFLKFDRIETKLSTRTDLHAFILLDKIFPGETGDIICAAEHDVYYIECDLDELAEKATEEQIVELIRCGVMIDEFGSGLSKFA